MQQRYCAREYTIMWNGKIRFVRKIEKKKILKYRIGILKSPFLGEMESSSSFTAVWLDWTYESSCLLSNRVTKKERGGEKMREGVITSSAGP